jgi:riboflavin synthase alpha subunit
MFTGLIEALGSVGAVARSPSGIRLGVNTDLSPDLAPGDSVAVNGVCLTAIDIQNGAFHADVSPETARVTTLGGLEAGALVNLERPLRADARVGGHFVQGHVDATGTIERIAAEGDSHRITIAVPGSLRAYIVHKGSIAVDGISLTVASIDGDRFDVQIVPFTWDHTNLKAARAGDPVNVECDILGKYVVRALALGRVADAAT